MSGRTRLIAAGVVALLVVALFYLFLIRPRKSELADLKVQVQEENQKTAQLNLELDHLRDLQANAPKAQAELAKIQQYVPKSNGLDDFIFQVTTAANQSGVDFSQITPTLPKTPPEGAAVAEIQMQIGAKGGYFAIQDFIRRLYSLKRAVRIDTVDLSAVIDQTTGVTEEKLLISARIFYELPDVAALGTTPTGTTPVPGATPSPTPAP